MKMSFKKVATGTAAVVSLALLGGAGMAIAADSTTTPTASAVLVAAPSSTPADALVQTEQSTSEETDSALEANDAQGEASETDSLESASDGVDQGPDMNATEPGHQDANGTD